MATHSSILDWRIPWTEELGGLQSTCRKESDTTEQLHFTFTFITDDRETKMSKTFQVLTTQQKNKQVKDR